MQHNILEDLGPLYNNYSFFGVDNAQISDHYVLNQISKEKILRAYIQLAIAKVEVKSPQNISFLEMFCADGYYAMMARKMGATISYGLDNNRDFHVHGTNIAERLGINNFVFIEADANNIRSFKPVDIVANLGGLYHVAEPEKILEGSYAVAKQFLIVQSVVSMENEDPDYFIRPAPGWTWGSRYSVPSFHKMITSKGWNILDFHANILQGNTRPHDMASVYYLIQK